MTVAIASAWASNALDRLFAELGAGQDGFYSKANRLNFYSTADGGPGFDQASIVGGMASGPVAVDVWKLKD